MCRNIYKVFKKYLVLVDLLLYIKSVGAFKQKIEFFYSTKQFCKLVMEIHKHKL